MVDERIGAEGEVLRPLDEDGLASAIQAIQCQGVDSVAVCLLHSFSNPAHERRVGELLRTAAPDLFVSLSVDVMPEIREYERTSTTVINSYLGPVVATYLDALRRNLDAKGLAAPGRVMQSDGGIMSAERAAKNPVRMIESGPAAGVVASHEAAKMLGLPNVITFDMGGTTAKASIIENGERSWTTEHEIGYGIAQSSRLVKGAGHAVKVPVIDLAEVGTGGGSIVRVDRGGILKVGPDSAGAAPGPACYGLGGADPTITDANVLLGYINPEHLAGGSVKLDADLAAKAINDTVATPLGMDLTEAAHGVARLANVTMGRAIKAVSTYRGRDPRDFVLMAFGGCGPVHAADLAASLGIGRVIVPPSPGLFSAVGLLQAIPEYHFVQTFFERSTEVDVGVMDRAFAEMQSRAAIDLSQDGYDVSELNWRRSAELRYSGQAFELTVQLPEGFTDGNIWQLVSLFHEEHMRTYGHMSPDEPVDIVNLRTTALADMTERDVTSPKGKQEGYTAADRRAYFGQKYGSLRTPLISRAELTADPQPGPLILEEYDATVVVSPGCFARIDDHVVVIVDVTADQF